MNTKNKEHTIEFLDPNEPELPKYVGFFVESHSADFIIKVCVTICSFLFVLLMASYHMARRKYRLPHSMPQEHQCAKTNYAESKLASNSGNLEKPSIVRCPFDKNKRNFLVNDPELASVILRHESASNRCSTFIGDLQYDTNFLGDFTPEMKIVRCVTKLALDGLLESGTVDLVVSNCIRRFHPLHEDEDVPVNGLSAVRRLLLVLLVELFFDCDLTDHEINATELEKLLVDYERLYSVEGLSQLDSKFTWSSKTTSIRAATRRLLLPLVTDAVETNEPESPTCFVDFFMQEKHGFEQNGCGEEIEFMTRWHLLGVIVDTLVIGRSTLSTALWYGLTELAQRPELCSDMAGMGVVDRHEAVSSFVLEVLRMYNVGANLLFRSTSGDLLLADWDLPRGSTVRVNVTSMNTDCARWDCPGEFHQDRFMDSLSKLEQEETDTEKSKPLLPFSVGCRKCPAHDFALFLLNALFDEFITKYRISLKEQNNLESDSMILVSPRIKLSVTSN